MVLTIIVTLLVVAYLLTLLLLYRAEKHRTVMRIPDDPYAHDIADFGRQISEWEHDQWR